MKKKTFVPLQQGTFLLCTMLVACAMTAGLLGAQSPAHRIAAEITRSEMSPLQGSQHPLALPQNDAGRMPADTRLNGISLYFNRSAAQQADLEALLAAQQNPSSPQYHQWLTPDQFAARFGMAQSDIEQVQSWLQQQGFSIDSIARSRNMIRFSGTVNQVEQAFSTQMHYYQSGGTQHCAPSTALSVPAAITPVLAGIRNLDNFRPRAQHIVPRAAFTSGQSGSVFFAPGDIATVYDVTPLYSASVNGTGQSIAVAGQSAIQVTDIENFQSASGLTKKDPTLVLVPGTGDSTVVADGDEGESDIDVEWSGAMAPGANVVFVYTGSNNNFGVFDSVQYAVDELIAPIISLSYASCETELNTSSLGILENVMSQAASQGQSIITASGDQGSTACSGDTALTTAQQEAVAVNYPASSAFVTGMGGTEITASDGVDPTTGNKGANYSTYWNFTSGTDLTASVKLYIPEVAWNDDSSQGGLSASGGGTSTLVNRPSWQTGVPGIPATKNATQCSSSNSGNCRLVPDISLYSSPALPGYLYCTSDATNWAPASGTQPAQQASCNSGFRDSSTNYLTVAGGTSFAAPIFAGMLALINQKAGYATGQGLINTTLYKLAADSSTYASAFHDVTSGNNNCTAGATLCSATTGFSAGTGYDEVTGLGSVDLSNLASKWPVNAGTSAGLIATTTTVVPANATPTVNVADTFTITVAEAGGSGTPTGSVTLKIDGGTDCGGISGDTCGGTTLSNQALSSNGTFTYSATFTTTGTHSILAQYSGDATHSPSTGVGSVTIGTTSSGKGTITMAATNVTMKQGSSSPSTITVTPAGGYTGTVLIGITNTSNNNALSNLCFSFTTQLSSGQGSMAVSSTTAATTQLTFDANASDCASTTGASKPGLHSLRSLRGNSISRGPGPRQAPNRLPAEVAFAGLLLAGFLGRYARKFRSAAWIIVLASAGLAMSACGGSSSSSTTVPNPPKGTYTITLTGTDSVTASITTTTTLTLTID
jgi:subtilase family serine protease